MQASGWRGVVQEADGAGNTRCSTVMALYSCRQAPWIYPIRGRRAVSSRALVPARRRGRSCELLVDKAGSARVVGARRMAHPP